MVLVGNFVYFINGLKKSFLLRYEEEDDIGEQYLSLYPFSRKGMHQMFKAINEKRAFCNWSKIIWGIIFKNLRIIQIDLSSQFDLILSLIEEYSRNLDPIRSEDKLSIN